MVCGTVVQCVADISEIVKFFMASAANLCCCENNKTYHCNVISDVCLFVCLFLARQPPVGQGLLIYEVSRSHTTTPHSR
jgi:hypothetical protein